MAKHIDINRLVSQIISAINDKICSLRTLNIIVAGKTGVGKSTLINSVFREELAATGIGRPVTDHIAEYSKRGLPLRVCDTRGFELCGEARATAMSEILGMIKSRIETGDVSSMIHCVWYCVSAQGGRFEEEEASFIREFSEMTKRTQVPVTLVLTKCVSRHETEEMTRAVKAMNLPVSQVIPVLAKDYPINEECVIPAFGLDDLVLHMGELLPRELSETLQNVQKVSLDAKIKAARSSVAAAVAAAAAAGASPIPFSDAFVLVPIQVGMIAAITSAFGLGVDTSVITGFVSSVLGSTAATIAGKTFVSNVIKLIPGAGSLIGGAVSAATAGALTGALGEAYIKLMTRMFSDGGSVFGIVPGQWKWPRGF